MDASTAPTATTTEADPRTRLEQVRGQLFFIVGCGRSGTTLLQSMLLSVDGVVIPPETKFWPAFPGRAWLYGDLSQDAAYTRAAERVWADQNSRGIETDRDVFMRFAEAAERSWAGLLTSVLAAYAARHAHRRVGEKSPVHTHYVGELMTLFPDAKFIHIMRDPRAVVLSRMTAGFGTKLVGPNIRRWQRAIDMHDEFAGRLGPSRYLLVKYEDLVREPEPILRRVCELINLEFTASMLEPHKRKNKGFAERSKDWMENTLKPISTESIEKWRRNLKPSHVAMIEHALRDGMRDMGYEPSRARTLAPGLRVALSEFAGKVEDKWGWCMHGVRKAVRGGRPPKA